MLACMLSQYILASTPRYSQVNGWNAWFPTFVRDHLSKTGRHELKDKGCVIDYSARQGEYEDDCAQGAVVCEMERLRYGG